MSRRNASRNFWDLGPRFVQSAQVGVTGGHQGGLLEDLVRRRALEDRQPGGEVAGHEVRDEGDEIVPGLVQRVEAERLGRHLQRLLRLAQIGPEGRDLHQAVGVVGAQLQRAVQMPAALREVARIDV
jgi:hypothetical protein